MQNNHDNLLNNLNIQFLRYSIDDNAPLPEHIEQMDWDELLEFAKKQSIVGVLFHGMKRMGQHPCRPNKYQIVEWYTISEELKEENKQANRDAAMLTYLFFKKGNIKSCVIKGQANALMYPDPYMRTPGDIDLWTDQEPLDIICFVRSLCPTAGIEYHHVDCPLLKKTPAEVHMQPSFMGNLWHEHLLKKYCRQVRDEQFVNIVSLPDKAGRICTVTDSFNRVFQLTHVMHHFFFEGVGFRQIIDYYYLLRRGMTEEERQADMKVIKRLNMVRFTKGMMWLMHDVLGLDKKLLLTEPNEKIGRLLLSEIIKAGNFGFHDERYSFRGRSVYSQYFLEMYRNLHFAWYFPSETIWGRPVSRWWHMIYKAYIRRRVKNAMKKKDAQTRPAQEQAK